MIDTIVFKIEAGNSSRVLKGDYLSPEFSKRGIEKLSDTERATGHTKRYLRRFILRPPKELGYTPRVEIFEKLTNQMSVIYEVRVEVSVAKLLYGNNLQEIDESDLNSVCSKIQETVLNAGVRIRREAILNAPVSRLHLGKNILLPGHIHSHEIVEAISKSESTKSYENSRERYGNDGTLARIRSGSREDVFYDKIKDMLKTKSKAVDKTGKDVERAFVETYNLERANILRYEHRFLRIEPLKSSVNGYLKREYNHQVTFTDVFNNHLWRHVLQKTWRNIYDKPANQTLFRCLEHEPSDIARTVMQAAFDNENIVHSQNSALMSFGLAMLIRECGADMVRNLCLDVWSEKTCGLRLTEKIQRAEQLIRNMPISDAMNFVDTEMQSFKRLTLASLQEYRTM